MTQITALAKLNTFIEFTNMPCGGWRVPYA
jgi:hypothetical protein